MGSGRFADAPASPPDSGSAVSVIDDLDRHLDHNDDLAAASIPMGMFLAWAVNHHLVDESALAEHERSLLRVRFREMRGSELIVTLGGRLETSMFSAQGLRFVEGYYDRYLDELHGLFADPYAIRDDWEHYDRVAGMLTQRFRGARSRGATVKLGQKIKAGWRKLFGAKNGDE